MESFWRAFSNRGLHLSHSNINGLLPKIDELRDIAKRTKAAVIGISESKLDSTVLDPEIYFENYEILHFDGNRHGRRVACCIRSISDHQLIYCTRKTAKIKSYCRKQITFRSLENYSPEIYEETLTRLSFPNYELFDEIDTAYENFIQKVMAVIDNLKSTSKTNALRVHRKTGLMLKSRKK